MRSRSGPAVTRGVGRPVWVHAHRRSGRCQPRPPQRGHARRLLVDAGLPAASPTQWRGVRHRPGHWTTYHPGPRPGNPRGDGLGSRGGLRPRGQLHRPEGPLDGRPGRPSSTRRTPDPGCLGVRLPNPTGRPHPAVDHRHHRDARTDRAAPLPGRHATRRRHRGGPGGLRRPRG